jgi:hypothetical protein
LQALKHAGRGHDPTGAAATSQGELVMECPACPIPGKNLPDNWEDAKPEERYVFILLIIPLVLTTILLDSYIRYFLLSMPISSSSRKIEVLRMSRSLRGGVAMLNLRAMRAILWIIRISLR